MTAEEVIKQVRFKRFWGANMVCFEGGFPLKLTSKTGKILERFIHFAQVATKEETRIPGWKANIEEGIKNAILKFLKRKGHRFLGYRGQYTFIDFELIWKQKNIKKKGR